MEEKQGVTSAAGFSGADAKSLFKAVHGRGYTLGVAPEKITVDE